MLDITRGPRNYVVLGSRMTYERLLEPCWSLKLSGDSPEVPIYGSQMWPSVFVAST